MKRIILKNKRNAEHLRGCSSRNRRIRDQRSLLWVSSNHLGSGIKKKGETFGIMDQSS